MVFPQHWRPASNGVNIWRRPPHWGCCISSPWRSELQNFSTILDLVDFNWFEIFLHKTRTQQYILAIGAWVRGDKARIGKNCSWRALSLVWRVNCLETRMLTRRRLHLRFTAWNCFTARLLKPVTIIHPPQEWGRNPDSGATVAAYVHLVCVCVCVGCVLNCSHTWPLSTDEALGKQWARLKILNAGTVHCGTCPFSFRLLFLFSQECPIKEKASVWISESGPSEMIEETQCNVGMFEEIPNGGDVWAGRYLIYPIFKYQKAEPKRW